MQKKTQLLWPCLLVFMLGTSLQQLVASSFYTPSKVALDRVISGKVTDASNGQALIGVNVLLKNSAVGTTTDVEGNYSLRIPDGDQTLVVSYVGYQIIETQIAANQTSLNISLQIDNQNLNEVVVLGYGSQQRKDVTGSVASINSKEFASVPLQNLEQAMQGRAAGVLVTQNSGAPGGAINVLIRGVGTTGGNEPIYVIDGVITGSGSNDYGGQSALSSLNPNDIESIDILKDASAAAIYGSRGANGVVIITTKRGKSGKPKVALDSYFGTQSAWRTIGLLDARQHAEYVNEAFRNAGKPASEVPKNLQNPASITTNVNWLDELFRAAPFQSHNLSISGGGDKATFSLSGNIFDQQGIMIGTYFKRQAFRANSDFKLSNRIRIGQSLQVSRTERRLEGSYGGRLQLEHAIKQAPSVPIFNDKQLGGYNGPGTDDGQDAENVVAVAAMYTNRPVGYRILGNVYGELDIVDGLTYRLEFGVDYGFSDGFSYNPANQMVRGLLNPSQLSVSRGIGLYNQFTQTLRYNKSFGEHKIEVLGGFERQSNSNSFLSTAVRDLPNNAVISISAGQQPNAAGGTYENALESILGRFNYSFKGKYLLTANVRRDGSSKLAPSNRFQVFPSFSLGWKIGEEAFLRSSSVLSKLKIRAGYGELGNVASLPDYPFAVSLITSANYNFGGTLISGVTQTNIANPNIRWETAATSNIGVDGTLFNGALDFTVEYYVRETKGLQVFVPIPASVGLGSAAVNAGNILNRGLDLSLSYRKVVNEDLTFSINGNLSTIHNEVKSLGGGEPIRAGNTFSLGNLTKTEVGNPIGAFYGWKAIGVFQSAEEVAKAPKQADQTAAGDVRFADLNSDGKITEADQTYLGKPIPDFFYGLTGNLTFKGFDFSIFFQGVQGNSIFNALRTWTEGLDQNFNQGTAALERWTGPGTSNSIPRAILGDPNNNKRNSDRFVEDASFLRLKNLTIGYTFKPMVLSKLGGLSKLRLYATAQNLLTFTKYSGFDPEQGSSNGSALARGIDIGNYPQARSIVAGLSVGF